MTDQSQKTQESTTVRIAVEMKKRLQKVVRHKTAAEDRDVTEQELVSKAVETLCEIEEKQLGI
jgi:hypothetical protein